LTTGPRTGIIHDMDNTPAATPQVKLLSQEERNDLRKRVLAGEALSLEEARQVIETIRQGRGAAALSAEAKPKKPKAAKPGMSDEELNASLDAKLKF
jgi:hypothetical protein